MRVHYAVSKLLQSQLSGKHERASLQAVQLLRALHQVSLDQGSWKTGSLLMSHADPLEGPKFGGEPDQLEKIASYVKAMTELEKRSLHGGGQEDDSQEKKGRGKGKNRSKTGVHDEISKGCEQS